MENFGELSESLAWEGFSDAGIEEFEPTPAPIMVLMLLQNRPQ
jgi:hypothetical protein